MTNFFFHNFFLKAAFVWSCFLFAGCENDPAMLKEVSGRKANIEEAVNVQSLLSQNGAIKAKLVAPYMLRYSLDTSYLEFPKKLHVNFYDSTGKVESQVDALYGKYLETQSKVYLRDSVIVFTVKGDTLRTQELWWDQNTKKFYTNKLVRIVRKGQHMVGDKGMEASQDLTHLTVYQIAHPSFITMPDSMRTQ